MPHFRFYRRMPRGFTLTELAIVLGVIGAVLSGIWVGASTVYTNQKIVKGTTEILAISSSIRALYAAHPYFASANQTDITCSMVSFGIFPKDMVSQSCVTGNTATYPVNPWGTPAIVYSSTSAPDASATQFELQFAPIPPSATVAMAISMSHLPASAGITYIYNNGWIAYSSASLSTITSRTDTNFSTDWKLGG